MKKVSKSSTGLNSVFDRLYKINSKILLFNYDSADDAGTTFVHYVEQKKKVQYRYLKKFKGKVSKNNKDYTDVFDMYVRVLNSDVKVYLKRLHKYMIANKSMRRIEIFNNTLPINSTSCKKMQKQIFKCIKNNPYFLLKKKPQISFQKT